MLVLCEKPRPLLKTATITNYSWLHDFYNCFYLSIIDTSSE